MLVVQINCIFQFNPFSISGSIIRCVMYSLLAENSLIFILLIRCSELRLWTFTFIFLFLECWSFNAESSQNRFLHNVLYVMRASYLSGIIHFLVDCFMNNKFISHTLSLWEKIGTSKMLIKMECVYWVYDSRREWVIH